MQFTRTMLRYPPVCVHDVVRSSRIYTRVTRACEQIVCVAHRMVYVYMSGGLSRSRVCAQQASHGGSGSQALGQGHTDGEPITCHRQRQKLKQQPTHERSKLNVRALKFCTNVQNRTFARSRFARTFNFERSWCGCRFSVSDESDACYVAGRFSIYCEPISWAECRCFCQTTVGAWGTGGRCF